MKNPTFHMRILRRRFPFVLLLISAVAVSVGAQEIIPLWPKAKMPNSKGLIIPDSFANERIYHVSTPVIRAFFPSAQENKGTAVILCPGGGYARLAFVTAGLQMAKWFNTLGVAAFVLDYRLPHSPDLKQREIGPLQDLQRAVKLVRSRAQQWGLAVNRIGVMGTSAGGHLASTLGTHSEDVSAIGDSLDAFAFVPDFMLLVSPVISMGKYAHAGSCRNLLGENPSEALIAKYSNELRVTSSTPPTFIVHAFDDKSVPLQNSLMFYQALVEKGVSSSLHVFPQGGHNIALRNNPGSTQLWTSLCEQWMVEMGFLPPLSEKR